MVLTEQMLIQFAPWLEAADGDPAKALCNYCACTFKSTVAGATIHSNTTKHKTIVQALERAEAHVQARVKEAQAQKKSNGGRDAAAASASSTSVGPSATPATRHVSQSQTGSPKVHVKCRVCFYNNKELEAENLHMCSLPCGHLLCQRCLPQVLVQNAQGDAPTCPNCRTVAYEEDCTRLFLD